MSKNIGIIFNYIFILTLAILHYLTRNICCADYSKILVIKIFKLELNSLIIVLKHRICPSFKLRNCETVRRIAIIRIYFLILVQSSITISETSECAITSARCYAFTLYLSDGHDIAWCLRFALALHVTALIFFWTFFYLLHNSSDVLIFRGRHNLRTFYRFLHVFYMQIIQRKLKTIKRSIV